MGGSCPPDHGILEGEGERERYIYTYTYIYIYTDTGTPDSGTYISVL